MCEPFIFRLTRNVSIALVCAALAACASTQRSSSAGGDQAAAPISDSSPPAATSDAVTKPSDANAGETNASALPSAGKPPGADVPRPTTGNAQQSENAISATDVEAAQMKRQLAEHEAEISRLRSAQEAEAAKREQQAAQERVQPSAGPSSATDGTQTRSAAPRPAKRDDDIAAFPVGEKDAASAEEGSAVALGDAERSIYFGYDQYTISEKYDAIVLQSAAYLKAHPQLRFEVQGNCDERGSREYNLALGARRAQSVKRALELGGADGARIQIVSFGSEKPLANGKDEESYQKNRRVDIVY